MSGSGSKSSTKRGTGALVGDYVVEIRRELALGGEEADNALQFGAAMGGEERAANRIIQRKPW